MSLYNKIIQITSFDLNRDIGFKSKPSKIKLIESSFSLFWGKKIMLTLRRSEVISQWRTHYLESDQNPSFYETFHLSIFTYISFICNQTRQFSEKFESRYHSCWNWWSENFRPDILRCRRIHKRQILLSNYRDFGGNIFNYKVWGIKALSINYMYIIRL